MVKKSKKEPEKNYELNRKIAEYIKSLGISVNKFAHSLGLDRSDNIYNIVNEKVQVSAKTLHLILKVYPKFGELLYADAVFLSEDNKLDYKPKDNKVCLKCKAKDEIIRTQRKLIKSLEAGKRTK